MLSVRDQTYAWPSTNGSPPLLDVVLLSLHYVIFVLRRFNLVHQSIQISPMGDLELILHIGRCALWGQIVSVELRDTGVKGAIPSSLEPKQYGIDIATDAVSYLGRLHSLPRWQVF